MNKEEIEELKDFTIDLTDIDELALGLEVCSKKSNMVIQEFADTIIQLQQENQELKKQLETYEIEGYEQNEELNKMSFDIRKYKVQQKEFMNFLTEAINKLKLEQETSNSAILKANTDLQMEVYSIVLSKYKEIIGVLNEKINVL